MHGVGFDRPGPRDQGLSGDLESQLTVRVIPIDEAVAVVIDTIRTAYLRIFSDLALIATIVRAIRVIPIRQKPKSDHTRLAQIPTF